MKPGRSRGSLIATDRSNGRCTAGLRSRREPVCSWPANRRRKGLEGLRPYDLSFGLCHHRIQHGPICQAWPIAARTSDGWRLNSSWPVCNRQTAPETAPLTRQSSDDRILGYKNRWDFVCKSASLAHKTTKLLPAEAALYISERTSDGSAFRRWCLCRLPSWSTSR